MISDKQATPVRPRGGRKLQTRYALVRSALRLFADHGYEQTTVNDIAAEVKVSQRTFFRHFSNKEEVAFAVQDMSERHFLAALKTRPAQEPPFAALRQAVLESWDTIGDAIQQMVPLESHLRMYRVIECTPTLLAVHLRRTAEMEGHLATEIAQREGLDLALDPRPRVLVAAFCGVMRVTGEVWAVSDDHTLPALRQITERYLDDLGAALTEEWRASRGSHA